MWSLLSITGRKPICVGRPLRCGIKWIRSFCRGQWNWIKRVLGICRGLQLMNSVYGGTLYQDLPTEHPSPISHRMQPPYDQAAHSVLFPAGTPLAQLLGTEQCGVNSCHHQGIQTLSPSFSPMAQAEDGLIEGIFMPHKTFVWGVQWHPEFSYLVRPESRAIVLAFVQAASRE